MGEVHDIDEMMTNHLSSDLEYFRYASFNVTAEPSLALAPDSPDNRGIPSWPLGKERSIFPATLELLNGVIFVYVFQTSLCGSQFLFCVEHSSLGQSRFQTNGNKARKASEIDASPLNNGPKIMAQKRASVIFARYFGPVVHGRGSRPVGRRFSPFLMQAAEGSLSRVRALYS